jgi:hypothetical protein
VILSDESSFTLFLTSGRVYVWRTPKEAYNPECLISRVKQGGSDGLGSSIMVQYSVGPIIILHGRITVREYVDRLDNQVHLMIQTLFPNNVAFSKVIATPFTQYELFNHGFKSINMNFSIFPVQHSHQISTSLSRSCQFWRLGLGRDYHLRHFWSNLKMFFKKNVIKFR